MYDRSRCDHPLDCRVSRREVSWQFLGFPVLDEMRLPQLNLGQLVAKRAVAVGASSGLLLTALMMAGIGTAIEPVSRERPSSSRKDAAGVTSSSYIRKLHGVHVDAEETLDSYRSGVAGWAISELLPSEDPQIARRGAVLCRTRLDELPQLINVLSREMLPVGDQPATPPELKWTVPIRAQRGYGQRWRVGEAPRRRQAP